METLTINIKRQFFAAIVSGAKLIEYRKMSPFWKGRIEPLTPPFELRLLNGMTPPVPEATVIVTQVTRDLAAQKYELHLGEVLQVQHWEDRGANLGSKPRKSHRDDPLEISSALASLVGPGNKSLSEIVKLFWSYVADHKLQLEGTEVFRVDPILRGLVGPKETVTLEEVVDVINENIGSVQP